MEPYYADDAVTLHHGDCLDVLRELPDGSVDAVVTDPPYGLEFMGREWDSFKQTPQAWATRDKSEDLTGKSSSPFLAAQVNKYAAGLPFQQWCQQWATECLRVLKPGGHLLAFGGARTWHRLTCAVEDAGFEIRDSIAWLYGSGFPKSLDVSKAIDKAAGAEREVVGDKLDRPGYHLHGHNGGAAFGHGIASTTPETRLAAAQITAPATPDAQTWQGWGTALKPAHEPIVVARKPLTGTVAANVLAHGTGALNVDGCRVGTDEDTRRRLTRLTSKGIPGGAFGHPDADRTPLDAMSAGNPAGRWPANVALDPHAAAELDRQSGTLTSGSRKAGSYGLMGYMGADDAPMPEVNGDSGGASRFFPTFRYEPKAPTAERPRGDATAHPTVKPLDLMRWLVRLVTPPGGTVLDPFAGSGTTALVAHALGRHGISVDMSADYCRLAQWRTSDRGQIAAVLDVPKPPVEVAGQAELFEEPA